MRERYVKKCMCIQKKAVITKHIQILNRNVLDIRMEVFCPVCERPYKMVSAKMQRMADPKIVTLDFKFPKVIVPKPISYVVEKPAIETENGGRSDVQTGGDVNQETESSNGYIPPKEPDAAEPQEEAQETESTDKERDSDEGSQENQVETSKKGRWPGFGRKNKGDVEQIPDRSVEKGLQDSGVPKEDIF